MEIGSFEVESKTFIMKRIYRNETFRGMQGNVLNGFRYQFNIKSIFRFPLPITFRGK